MEPSHKDVSVLTAEEVFTPWEMDGRSRRDSKRHRAGLLRGMAYVSILAGGASWICVVTAFIGLVLGLAAWRMACRDLDLIRRGDMDTGGFHQTEKARSDARAGTILCLLGLFLWSVLAVFVIYYLLIAASVMRHINPGLWPG
jgi:hypothetical protein